MDVQSVREQWAGKFVYCDLSPRHLSPRYWETGVVRFVSDDGFAYIDLLNRPGWRSPRIRVPIEKIPQMLRLY